MTCTDAQVRLMMRERSQGRNQEQAAVNRESLFPSVVFRQAWDQLNQWYSPRKADLIYLRLLQLAACTLESEVADILNLLLDGQQRWDDTDVARLLQSPRLPVIPQLSLPCINLARYDRLLQEVNHDPR